MNDAKTKTRKRKPHSKGSIEEARDRLADEGGTVPLVVEEERGRVRPQVSTSAQEK